MTETKFTPGPWHVEASRLNPHDEFYVTRKDGGSIADTFIEANANLIAAAPDLYAALFWVENGIPAECFGDDETTQVVFTGKDLKAFAKARRKARGE